MSLFKAREWWHSQGAEGEEFDGGCLCVANIDNDPTGKVKIVTGSFQGNLRIYAPSQRDYQVDDLLLEQVLEVDPSPGFASSPIPILQIEAGCFASVGGLHLAVLHPRKLSVYSCTQLGTHAQLTKMYEHVLDHTAANMTFGPFGSDTSLDYIAVQSYDGQLSIFECELFAFSRFLPNFLIPGPICYCPPSDSFITSNAAFELECYKYKVLASASGEKTPDGPATGPASGHQVAKRVQADWKVILGESAVDIRVGNLSPSHQGFPCDIIVLCEHNVFMVNSMGQITFQKRLEYHPACCITYPVPGSPLPGGTENLLVITHTAAALVYRHNVLSWAARMDVQPVAVRVLTYEGPMKGMIVTMNDEGSVVVCYLGTDPMTNSVGFVEGKEPDYESMARESRGLAAIIREHSGGSRVEPPDKLLMRAQVPALLNNSRGDHDMDSMSRGGGRGSSRRLTAKLYLTYQGGSTYADNVTLNIRCPEPVTVEEPTMVVPIVGSDSDDPTVVPITFISGSGHIPSSCMAIVSATFQTSSGEPRAQSLEVVLPLVLFASVVPPVKNAEFKITLTTNRTPPQLTAIFEDVLAQAGPTMTQTLASSSAGANVLSVQYHSGEDCTILVSKNGGRYRLQSDNFAAMWLVVYELHRRLGKYYEEAEGDNSSEGPFRVNFEDALPLEDFYEIMDAHFAVRKQASELRNQLEDRATQFRQIEKRLLMRFRDKNPAPLNQLDVLVEETYSSLMELGSSLATAQDQVASAGHKLGGAVHLVLLLIKFRFGISDEEYAVFKSYFSPEIIDGPDVGWEEHTESSMTQMLRTSLAKSAKEAGASMPQLAASKDTTKLKKHISLVLERLSKGMRIKVEENDLGPSQLAAANAAAATVGIPKNKRSSSSQR